MLVRQRLLDRLRARWFIPVTVVSAPAGYGKTTLLAQAVEANAGAPLGVDRWLTCGSDERIAARLGRALSLAVGATPPDDEGLDIGDHLRVVIDGLSQWSPRQVALLVDDAQEIPPGSEAAVLLTRLANELPANAHLVVASRGQPPVPLSRLDVAGRVVHLGQDDLAFTDDELAQFARLRGVAGSTVTSSVGWPALAELSASASTELVSDYVGQEVLSRIAPIQRRQLAVLAHVGNVDRDLARAVLGPDVDATSLVEGLPLVTRLPNGEWSLHALWRSLLANELTPGELEEVRHDAGVLVRERGELTAAVRLFIEARTWDDVTATVVESLGAAHPPVPHEVLAEWLVRLPVDLREGPCGRLLDAVVATQSEPGAAWVRFEEAAAAFREAGDDIGELACLVQLGQLAWWSEDPDRLATLANRVFQLEAAGCRPAVPLACLARALIIDVQNDSRRVLSELDRIPPGSLNDVWQGVVSWFRSISHMHLGEAQAALDAAEQALRFAGPLHRTLAEAARLQALWYLGDVEAVRDALPGLVERMERAGHRNYASLASAQCCTMLAQHGDASRAADFLARARAAATSLDTPLVATNLALAEAALAVATTDEARATAVLRAHLRAHPLGLGHSAAPQQRNLALLYVLVPDARPVWDAADLGPVFRTARDLARDVVVLREQGQLPTPGSALADVTAVRTHLPLRWAAELGVAAVDAGRDDGWRLLDHMWPAARAAVIDLSRQPRSALRAAARTTLSTLAVPPTGRLELGLLGPVELRRDGAPVGAADWRRERVRLLLAYLAIHRSVSRTQLADELWPGLDLDAQSRNLRVNLTHLLRVLEPDRAPRDASFFVRQDMGRLVLHPDQYLAVDLWTFDDEASRAAEADRKGDPSVTLPHALRAVELWRGEPVELVSQTWALAPIEQRRIRFAGLAARAGELLLAQGNPESAHALASRAITADPWLESAHRLVVAAHRAQGDDLAARRALVRYREAISEIGVSPDEATLMVERLLD